MRSTVAVLAALLVVAMAGCGGTDKSLTGKKPTASQVVITKRTRWSVANLPGEAIATNAVEQVFGQTSLGSYLWQDGRARRFDEGWIGLPGDAAINDRGQVSMECGVVTERSAFLWEEGRTTDLGTLGGDTSQACDISNDGRIVGSAGVARGDEDRSHAFLWEDGKMRDLGTLGGPGSWAVAINEQGQIAGFSDISEPGGFGQRHAFLWEDGNMRDLGTLGGPGSWPNAMNESGQVVGDSETSANSLNPNGVKIYVSHAFLWDGQAMVNLGTLGGGWSDALAINERGQVVGYADIEGQGKYGFTKYHGFLWQDGTMTDLGTLGGPQSEACAINDAGQIVGFADTKAKDMYGDPISHAFVWQQGAMYDLGVAGGECGTDLISIDNESQIVALSHVLTPSPR